MQDPEITFDCQGNRQELFHSFLCKRPSLWRWLQQIIHRLMVSFRSPFRRRDIDGFGLLRNQPGWPTGAPRFFPVFEPLAIVASGFSSFFWEFVANLV